jgi:hypothetical protein
MLIAIAVLVVNDHALKAAWPGPVTGKLSDIAGLFFFPVLLVACVEVLRFRAGRRRFVDTRYFLASAALVSAWFAAIKLSSAASVLHGELLGTIRWVLRVPVDLVRGAPLGEPVPVVTIADTTDLLALSAAVAAVYFGANHRPLRKRHVPHTMRSRGARGAVDSDA